MSHIKILFFTILNKFLDFCSQKEFRFRFLSLVYFQHDIINDVVQKYSQKKYSGTYEGGDERRRKKLLIY